MSTTQTQRQTRTGESTVHGRWLVAARVALGLLGAQLLPAALYFTFFAAAQDGGVVTAFDWFVAVWAIAVAVALLATALLPFPSRARRLQVAWWVMGAHFVWGLVKLLAYDEMPVSAIVVLVDVAIFGLLWLAGWAHPPVSAQQDARSARAVGLEGNDEAGRVG